MPSYLGKKIGEMALLKVDLKIVLFTKQKTKKTSSKENGEKCRKEEPDVKMGLCHDLHS